MVVATRKAEVVSTKGQRLEDLLFPFTKSQSDFLCMSVLGIPKKEALLMLGLKSDTYNTWLTRPTGFAELEVILAEKQAVFFKEAETILVAAMPIKARFYLNMLLDKAANWDNLDLVDKGYVYRAIELTNKMLGVRATSPLEKTKGSYEELVHRIHLEHKET